MLQWFISFPEFAEFTEILFYLGKTQLQWKFQNLLGEKQPKFTETSTPKINLRFILLFPT